MGGWSSIFCFLSKPRHTSSMNVQIVTSIYGLHLDAFNDDVNPAELETLLLYLHLLCTKKKACFLYLCESSTRLLRKQPQTVEKKMSQSMQQNYIITNQLCWQRMQQKCMLVEDVAEVYAGRGLAEVCAGRECSGSVCQQRMQRNCLFVEDVAEAYASRGCSGGVQYFGRGLSGSVCCQRMQQTVYA